MLKNELEYESDCNDSTYDTGQLSVLLSLPKKPFILTTGDEYEDELHKPDFGIASFPGSPSSARNVTYDL